MNGIRVIATNDRLYTVENGRGDRFSFHFPTRNGYDSTLADPPIWKDDPAPGSMTARMFTDTARRIATVQAVRDGILDPLPLRRSLEPSSIPKPVQAGVYAHH